MVMLVIFFQETKSFKGIMDKSNLKSPIMQYF
jgi:hypothetical protein